MRILGVMLIVLGLVAFIWGGISYTKQEDVLNVGGLHATVEHKKRVPLPPILGGVALLAGALLLIRPTRTAA
jgi:hypothetical protein